MELHIRRRCPEVNSCHHYTRTSGRDNKQLEDPMGRLEGDICDILKRLSELKLWGT